MIASPPTPDLGLFGPHSTVWHVDREIAVLLGSGSRALMLQVAHPKVAAAVDAHSRYRSDPLGRLRDTLNSIYGFTFASMPEVDRILGHIHHLHTHVRGRTAGGEPYTALDPHLLLWVYATLIDSSLLAYETFVAPLTLAQREQYYADLRRVGPLWGIRPSDFPDTLVGLRFWMADRIRSGEVHVSPQGRYVGRFLLEPKGWWLPPPAALLLRQSTVWQLPPSLREGFGYSWGPRREAAMRSLAALSRAIVPRLPHALRDLPTARSAYRRVRRAEARAAAGGVVPGALPPR
ncbi:MAG: DUF2236 domain-containing protein [Chloroflexi bacterium]|nr:DUF2236 domain-containing protein [Chloroflexota bacterium]MBV9893245.1 DUF2236 domain-containing protein [Chloroflexota bacterium]